MPINNQWYTEAFRDGMRAVFESRETVNQRARAMPVAEGDAFLAGFYSERRRLRQHDEQMAEGIFKILRGEAKPASFARSRELTDAEVAAAKSCKEAGR
jgi:hypothetical protein